MNLKTNPMTAKAVSKAMGVLFAAVASVVMFNEGYKEVAYPDSAGVQTICYGETKGVKAHQTATKAQCDAQLVQSISEHSKALVGLPEGMPDVVLIGGLDMAYNLGVPTFKGGSVYTNLLLRDYKSAGSSVLRYRYISQTKAPAPALGWTYNTRTKRWQFDCSQSFNGKRNTVCWGLWERRQWQAKAIGNEFKSVQEAISALPK